MAKQAGIIKLKGTIDDLSFYKTVDGHLARAKGGIDKNKILNDPAFQRTRENNSEFGAAGKGGKLIRTSVRHLMQNAKDRRVVSRLTKELLAIIKTDPLNPRGKRTIQDGNLEVIEGFDFNSNAPLSTTLYVGYTTNFNRTSGEVTANLEAFSPTIRIAAPTGTTHFKLSLGAAEIDFVNMQFVFSAADTGVLPYTAPELPANTLTAPLSPDSDLPVLQVIGVEFYQMVNGEYYSLKNGANNALAIVSLDTV
ncbi:hypothetical protein [Ulvibacter litoralis]|uniref:Uncharacterized protein n=1 Tax=Ulvibacter litoralis TaxID=227084 RepID=A0A1G7JBP6_9FLAO|nr:hypothetical protein [Ulvibacter litoralis]GHC64493.1 hypothetical protein GCM10008083_32130 [Ulvibacter litoralis]SDF22397.1 hypothetical protein SAMN05421855_11028 [Ulvibacter litoralis]